MLPSGIIIPQHALSQDGFDKCIIDVRASMGGFLRRRYGRFFSEADAPIELGLPTTLAESGTRAAASSGSYGGSRYTSGAVTGDVGGFSITPVQNVNALRSAWQFYGAVILNLIAGQSSDVRFWAVLTNDTLANMQASDSPAGASYAGFRYSTAAGDANIKAICAAGGTQTIVNPAAIYPAGSWFIPHGNSWLLEWWRHNTRDGSGTTYTRWRISRHTDALVPQVASFEATSNQMGTAENLRISVGVTNLNSAARAVACAVAVAEA